MAKTPQSYSVKDRVSHAAFGPGTVVEVNARYTSILFDEGGQRKFVNELVKLQPSDEPAPAKPRRKTTKKKVTKSTAKKTTKKAAAEEAAEE